MRLPPPTYTTVLGFLSSLVKIEGLVGFFEEGEESERDSSKALEEDSEVVDKQQPLPNSETIRDIVIIVFPSPIASASIWHLYPY